MLNMRAWHTVGLGSSVVGVIAGTAVAVVITTAIIVVLAVVIILRSGSHV